MRKIILHLFIIFIVPIMGVSQPSNFLILDGTESIVVGNTNDINTANTLLDRTVEFWFKADDVSHTNREVIYEEGGNVRGINFWVENGYVYLGMYNDADGSDLWRGTWFRTAISSGQWYHVALVLRGGDNTGYPSTLNEKLEWYLNGALQDTGHGGVLHDHPGDIRISSTEVGVFPKDPALWNNDVYEATVSTQIEDKSTSYFAGAVGILRVWNSARTETQIYDNINTLITSIGTDGLVAYLNGDKVSDTGGDSGSDGTLMPPANPTDLTYDNDTGNNDWTDPLNWYGINTNDRGNIPSAGDDITIKDNGTGQVAPIIPAGTYYFSNISVANNNFLTLNNGVYFNITNKITNSGTLNINGASANFYQIDNNKDFNIDGSLLVNDTFLNDNGGTVILTTSGEMDVNAGFTNNGTFTIKSDASGTGSLITNGAVANIGAFNVERYVAYTSYGSISSPVVTNSSVFSGHQLFSHDEANRAGGQPYTSLAVDGTVDLNPMEGYIFLLDEANFPAERKFYFTGTPNSGDYTFTLTSTDYTGNGDYYGWNMVGNPYPSSITWTQTENNIANTKVNSTMYLFDGANNRWVFFNPTLPAVNSEIDNIPLGQAFFVQLNSSAPSNTSLVATFTNSLRAHNTGNVNFGTVASGKKAALSKSEIDYPDYYFELKASVNGREDKAYYHFKNEATSEFDNKYDSYKLMAWNGGQPNVYFYSGDTKTSIQQEPETESVEVGFYVSSGDQVEFSLENTTSFSSLVLEDRKEGTFTDLLLTSYIFTNDNSFNQRFILHFKKKTLSENIEVVNVTNIYYSENELHVVFKENVKNGNIDIFDTQGRFVLSQSIKNSNKEVVIQSDLNKGVYIVRVNTDKGQVSKTIILK